MIDFQYIFEYFNGEPLIIQIIWMVSCVLFVTAVVLIIYLKVFRSHLRKNEKIVKTFQKKYEKLLITYLYAGSEEKGISVEQQAIINKLKSEIKNEFKREIVINSLLKLRNEISGEMADAIQELYCKAGLLDHSLIKLRSSSWYIIAMGIRELTQFNIEKANKQVVKYANHSKSEVRKEVQLYLVNLFHFKGLDFLDDLKVPLSEWDQIQLLEVLQRSKDQEICNIIPWLKSKNDSVVIFALKLAEIYNQYETKETLLELVSHKSEKVRIELMRVLNHLTVFESKEALKSTFNTRSKDEQIAFFKLLENMYDTNDEAFLLEQIYNKNFEIKFEALKILKLFHNEQFNNLKLTPPESEFVKIAKFLQNN